MCFYYKKIDFLQPSTFLFFKFCYIEIGGICMNTYYIYKLSTQSQQLFNQYPNIKQKILSLEPKNPYFTNQMEALIDSNDKINEYLFDCFKERSDYRREQNLHIIHNLLTKETITCKVDNFSIEIKAPKKSNIFYDILYQQSRNYVIMEKKCIKQEV